MGLGSSLKKFGKKISKGLKKLGKITMVGAITKKVWTEVKRAWKTKLGRVLLIGAAIWATGGLLAMHYGIASGTSAFTFGNAMAGLSQGASVLAGKLGMEGLSAKLAVTGGEAATAAGVTEAGAAATMNMGGGLTATIPGTAAAPMTAAQVASAQGAAAAAAGAPAAAASGGFMGMSTGAGIATAGLLQAGGSALAAANAPSAGEEARDVLRATQRANDISGMQQQQFSGQPTARFVTPALQPPAPRPPTPGLLEPEPDPSGYGYGG